MCGDRDSLELFQKTKIQLCSIKFHQPARLGTIRGRAVIQSAGILGREGNKQAGHLHTAIKIRTQDRIGGFIMDTGVSCSSLEIVVLIHQEFAGWVFRQAQECSHV